MITLRMELILFSNPSIFLDENDWIQILDHHTQAHYRYNTKGEILLGGDPTGKTWDDLLNSEITHIDYNNNCLEVYIK